MTEVLAPLLFEQFWNATATAPLVGGKLFSYIAGTSTKQVTYTDSTGSVMNANPIILNSSGTANVWLDPSLVYKFVLAPANDTDPPGSPIRTVDNVSPSINASTLTQAFLSAILNPQTLAEAALSETPLNMSYQEGHLLRYLAAFVPGITDCTAALNTATSVCAYGKAILQLPAVTAAAPILISGTWDCTAKYTGPFAYPHNTNGGLWVRGAGKTSTYIQYIGGAANAGIAWDMSGASFGRFEGFTFVGGSSTANCPQCTLLQGAINVSGIVRSLNHTWIGVEIDGYGDYVVQNNGCEQQNFIDCTSIGWRDNTFSGAVPWTFVASGSTPVVSSVLATTFSPINSMTVCHWQGANAALIFHGSYGIFFHFSGSNTGACADIRFDDWFQVQTPSGPFKFMTDDSSGAAGQLLNNCGSERLTMEVASANGNMQVGNFSVSIVRGLKFEGLAGNGSPITARPFQFNSTCTPTGVEIIWNPSEGPSTWTGDYVVQCAGTEAGIKVIAPGIPDANLVNVTNSRTIDGFSGTGLYGQGSGYAQILGTYLNLGAIANAQFNRTRKVRAGAFVSANSDLNEGVQTTQGVTGAGATTILSFPNFGQTCRITGVATAGGHIFRDVVDATPSAFSVISSLTAQNSPAARTYSVGSSPNVLKLVMASGTYNVQVSCIGDGAQV